MRVTQAAGVAMLNALVDLLDAGSPPGNLIIYTGTEPATADTAISGQTEVATCAFANPAYGAASTHGTDDAQSALTSTATDASATGNASAVTFFRACNAAGVCVFQGTCSATAGDDLVLNTATIAAGSQVDITALTVSLVYNQA